MGVTKIVNKVVALTPPSCYKKEQFDLLLKHLCEFYTLQHISLFKTTNQKNE